MVEACEVVDNRALKRKISCFVEGMMKCDYYLSHQSHEEEEEVFTEELVPMLIWR